MTRTLYICYFGVREPLVQTQVLPYLREIGDLTTDFDAESFLRAFEKIESLGDVRSRCREAAKNEFDLESIGGKRYQRLYLKMINTG
jgi:hypothetical protein